MSTHKKILIVEDEKPLSDALVDKLSSEGYEVSHASNGKEGLDKAYAEKPDLILVDIIMPVMDGVTMLHELKKDEWGKTVKVIVLTNLSDSDQILKCIAEGVNEYLVKSDWKLVDILQKIKEVI